MSPARQPSIAPAAATAVRAGPGLLACFLALSGLLAALGSATWLAARVTAVTVPTWAAVLVPAALAAPALWWKRRTLFLFLTSLPFSVVLLGFLLAASALGTLIPQQAEAGEYTRRFGASFARGLTGLGLDDLFHSSWFRGLLGLLGLSLVLVPLRNRAWRPPLWGHLMCHAGIVVILSGGLLGSLRSFRGYLHLHEQVPVGDVLAMLNGETTGATRPLGFQLLLEDFALERHPAELRICAWRIDGDGMRLLRTIPLEQRGQVSLGADGTSIRLTEVQPGPLAKLDFRSGGQQGQATLSRTPGSFCMLPDRRSVLTLEERPGEVSAYRSRLAVLRDGVVLARKTIEVNDPLSFGGYAFLQSGYREEDPGYSGILVVRDPGYPLVASGLTLLAAGVLFVYYVRPWLARRMVA